MQTNISFGALPPRTKYITQNLIIGARQELTGLKQLQKEEQVTRIIDLRSSNDLKKLREKIFCRFLGLKYNNFPIELMNKKELDKDIFKKIFQIIDTNKDDKFFVHCNSGRHRSIFIASLIKFKNGTIKKLQDFQDFLTQNDFYKLRKKVRCGLKFKLTDKDIKQRTENLDYQKEKFWNFLNEL